MNICYAESDPIKVNYSSKKVYVLLVAECISINTDNSAGQIEGIVYGENCKPLRCAKFTISNYEYRECCWTDYYGRFRTNLSFKGKSCTIIISKPGYFPIYLKNYTIRKNKVKIFLDKINRC